MAEPHLLLLYDYVEDMAQRRGPYRDAHLSAIRAQPAIVMAGALGDPVTGGALVFKGVGPDVVENFVSADPYFQAGLIVSHRIQLWNVI